MSRDRICTEMIHILYIPHYPIRYYSRWLPQQPLLVSAYKPCRRIRRPFHVYHELAHCGRGCHQLSTHQCIAVRPRELTDKVRKTGGKSGEGKAKLSQAHRDAFARAWSQVVTKRLGFKDLRAMRAAWKKEQAAGPWGIFHLSGESNVIMDAQSD
jgi:hypothetical protein|eukprot:COSAG02_NODE_1240_length_13709_cov_14.174798_9_plen_155_part_00